MNSIEKRTFSLRISNKNDRVNNYNTIEIQLNYSCLSFQICSRGCHQWKSTKKESFFMIKYEEMRRFRSILTISTSEIRCSEFAMLL